MSNGAGELRNSLLGGQLPKSFQLLNDSYDEREVFRNIILSVQVVVTSHTQTGNYFHVFTSKRSMPKAKRGGGYTLNNYNIKCIVKETKLCHGYKRNHG